MKYIVTHTIQFTAEADREDDAKHEKAIEDHLKALPGVSDVNIVDTDVETEGE